MQISILSKTRQQLIYFNSIIFHLCHSRLQFTEFHTSRWRLRVCKLDSAIRITRLQYVQRVPIGSYREYAIAIDGEAGDSLT